MVNKFKILMVSERKPAWASVGLMRNVTCSRTMATSKSASALPSRYARMKETTADSRRIRTNLQET